jgi:putative aminopeptidase FrvX
MSRVVPWNELLVDVCTRSRAETEALGIKLLDPITLEKDAFVLHQKFVCGRALDDRFGCAALVQVLQRLAKRKLKRRVSLVWSVREEIGLQGALVIGNRLAPDIVLAIDSYASADAPDVPFHLAPARLGDGPVLRFADDRAIASPALRAQLEALAGTHRIPLQVGATGGGTDGAAIQSSGLGAHMMAISVPIRYLHSMVEICHLDDFNRLVQLLEAAALELTVPDAP